MLSTLADISAIITAVLAVSGLIVLAPRLIAAGSQKAAAWIKWLKHRNNVLKQEELCRRGDHDLLQHSVPRTFGSTQLVESCQRQCGHSAIILQACDICKREVEDLSYIAPAEFHRTNHGNLIPLFRTDKGRCCADCSEKLIAGELHHPEFRPSGSEPPSQ